MQSIKLRMQILFLKELAALLQTTEMALYCRYSRNPESLPKRLLIPGDRRLMFTAEAVHEWLSAHQCVDVSRTTKNHATNPSIACKK